MRFVCFRAHWNNCSSDPGPPVECTGLMAYLGHVLWFHALLGLSMRDKLRLRAAGLIDVEEGHQPHEPFAAYRWRWDFWDSRWVQWDRARRAAEAQRDREAAVELWGPR